MIRFEGYELILGSSVDPQFGLVLLFGMGGQLVEVFEDRINPLLASPQGLLALDARIVLHDPKLCERDLCLP